MNEPMTDSRFEELLGADPLNQDAAFLAAARATAERQSAWQAACAFEARLRAGLTDVPAPDTLMARLLGLPDDAVQTAQVLELPRRVDNWLRRVLPVAAVLMMALGMSWYFQLDTALALQKDILGHIYAEAPFAQASAREILLDELNAHLETSLGAHLVASAATEQLEVTFVKDCRVAKQRATHLVMKGEQGPVNVIMLRDAVLDDDTAIGDARLSGRISPSAAGTLVVVGERQEPIDEYLRVLSSSIDWEY